MPEQGVGDLILRAAQGIVAQKQQQQQMALQQAKFEEQQKQQSKNEQLKSQEFEIRERTLKVQEDQNERSQNLEPFRIQQAELGLQKTQADIGLVEARTANQQAPGAKAAKGGLTANQQLRVHQDIDSKAVRLEMTGAASDYEDKTGAVGVPRLGTAEAYIKERKRLQTKVSEFQTSSTAASAKLINERFGDGDKLEIEKMEGQLNALNAFIGSDQFQTIRNRHDTAGPSNRSRAAITDNFYGEFKSQLGTPRAESKSFDFGSVPSDKIETAWNLFGQGNSDVMVDSILRSTGGKFSAEDQSSFEKDLQARFPEPGEEQDKAMSTYKRALQSINSLRNK